MTDQPLDPDLAARLRQLADERIRQQIAAAKKRASAMADTRTQFAEAREAGLRQRQMIRIRLINRHDQKGQP